VHEKSRQFTVYSQKREEKKSDRGIAEVDFNTEDTESIEEEGEESVRDEARGEGRFIEAVG